MTVLNGIFAEEAVFLMSDTIVSDPIDRSPVLFTTKIFPLPHLQGVICGTGIAQIVVEWMATANTSMLVFDMRHLDQFAPNALREIEGRIKDKIGEATTTVYHFGFDQETQKFVGYVYRSTKEYASEQLPYGYFYKPAPVAFTPDAVRNFPDDFVPIVQKQLEEEKNKPLEDKVGIGGHLIAYSLQKNQLSSGKTEIVTTIHRFHELSDFTSHYAQALAKLGK